MTDAAEFIEKMKALLAERDRAMQTVFDLTMERDEAEDEVKRQSAELFKAGEEIGTLRINSAAKFNLLTGQLREQDDQLARTEDALEKETVARKDAEKRQDILEKILSRVEDELHDAILEEDEFVSPEDMSEEDMDTLLYGGDPHEGPHGPVTKETVSKDLLWLKKLKQGSAAVPWMSRSLVFAKSLSKKLDTLPLKVKTVPVKLLLVGMSATFFLMTLFNVLAVSDIKVAFIADLIAPIWQPWMGSWWFQTLSFAIGLGSLLLLMWPIGPSESPGDEAALAPDVGRPPEPAKAEPDLEIAVRNKQIEEMFGGDDA